MSERDSGSGRGEGLTRAVANRDAKTQLSEVDHAPWPAAARLAPTAFKRQVWSKSTPSLSFSLRISSLRQCPRRSTPERHVHRRATTREVARAVARARPPRSSLK